MNHCLKTEEIKTAMDHFFNGLPCPENIIQILHHWKKNYWSLAPYTEFECDLLVNDFLKSKVTDFIVVMFFDCFINNLENEDHKRPFLNDVEKLEIAHVKQFIVDSNLMPY